MTFFCVCKFNAVFLHLFQQLPKARELCLRFSDLCKQIEVEALLCKHGISGEDYNNMTKQPEALIEKLYEDYGYRGEIVNGTLVGIPGKSSQYFQLMFPTSRRSIRNSNLIENGVMDDFVLVSDHSFSLFFHPAIVFEYQINWFF